MTPRDFARKVFAGQWPILTVGLFLLGAGQGLCITPLTTTVLSHADASSAGSVSGAMSNRTSRRSEKRIFWSLR